MKRLLSSLRSSAMVAMVCALAACDSNFITTQEDLAKDSNKSQELYNKTNQVQNKQSTIEHTDSYMVAQHSFEIQKDVVLPPVFSRKIIYSSASQESFSTILADLYSQTGIKFKFTPDAISYLSAEGDNGGPRLSAASSSTSQGGFATESGSGGSSSLESAAIEIGGSEVAASLGILKNIMMNLQYEGTFKGLVERFVAGFNIYWEYEPETMSVTFFRTQTKVLALDVLPGVTTFSNQMSSSSTMGGSGDTGGNLNSGAVMEVTYKQLESNTWKDTVSTIAAMLSSEGRVTPNPRSGYLAVTDIPERLARVEDFVNKINDKARRKIAVKVDVFNVELDAKTDYGVNWDAVIDALGGNVSLSSLNGGRSPLSNFGGQQIDTMKFAYTGSGFFDSAELIFGALSQQGDASKVTGTTIYTVNGEPAPVQIVTRSDYVKEITFSAISDQSSTTEVAITPGTIVSGFFMVVTPTILSDNQILLNLSLSLSTADTTSPERKETICPSGQTNQDLCPQITLPEVKSKNFMESVTLNAGQTVILSGFQELDNQVGVESVASPQFWMLGGSKATNSSKITTVTVITPYVVGR